MSEPPVEVMPGELPRPDEGQSGGRGAVLVAAGIFVSRLSGLVRNRVFAHYFGSTDIADAFQAAMRIPNILQNLFGEGALSASFIPVYARLQSRGEEEEAKRVAGAVATLLVGFVTIAVAVGMLLTPSLIQLLAPGFAGDKRELTIRLVRILFPGVGTLVLSAWCLGILNSHRRFFLSYAAPVVWNAAIIAAFVAGARTARDASLAEWGAWGALVGSVLQLLVQLPSVIKLLGIPRFSTGRDSKHVQTVLRNFGPVFVSRGVVQISAYVDSLIASLLGTGAVAAFNYAQLLYTLPVSLFGMSISAAELPAMSSEAGDEAQIHAALRKRLEHGLKRIAFFVVPSAVAFLLLGDIVAGALLQTGRFTRTDTVYVWAILAGSAVGLLAQTLGRLYSSTYYTLHDTRTPFRFAILRVFLTISLGYVAAIYGPRWFGVPLKWGAVGLTATAGIAGWVEFLLLRRGMGSRIGATRLSRGLLARLWASALLGAGVAWAVKVAMGTERAILLAVVALGGYGVIYFGVTAALGIPEAAIIRDRVRRILKR